MTGSARERLAKKERERKWRAAYRKSNYVRCSIRDHVRKIRDGGKTDSRWRCYRKMYVHPPWLKDYGRAQREIIADIGPWPGKKFSLHIVHHDLGIRPGNLEYADIQTQNHEKVRKICARQRREIETLKAENKKLRLKLREFRKNERKRKA